MNGQNLRFKIAIDGPAGAGKSTVARKLAEALDYTYIDTGAMYRAITHLVLREGITLDEPERIVEVARRAAIELTPIARADGTSLAVKVNGEDVTDKIRTQEVTRLVSPLSAIPEVRECLVEQQKKIAEKGGVVLDGRDIGTIVLPDAQVKVFLTASPEVRAQRRALDFQKIGETVDLKAILNDIIERDRRDSTRAVGPLKRADDAVEINTDYKSIEGVVKEVIALVKGRQKEFESCAPPVVARE